MNCHTLTGSQDLPVLLDAELKSSLTPWLDPSYLRRHSFLGNYSSSSSHQGRLECLGGQWFGRRSNFHGMVSGQEILRLAMQSAWLSPSGPVCHSDNYQLPVFVSPCLDSLAVGLDDLSLDWNLWTSIYLFPPFPVIPDVVRKLLLFRGSGFLIAPLWESANWFASLTLRCPVRFPLPDYHTLSQETSRGLVFSKLSYLKLHAWKL